MVNLSNPVIITIVVLGIVLSIYFIYRNMLNKSLTRPYFIKGNRDAQKPLIINRETFKESSVGNEVAYSFWINIHDLGYNFNKPKHIFHVGTEDGSLACPGVWLYPKDNNLLVRVDTYENSETDNKTYNSECTSECNNKPSDVESPEQAHDRCLTKGWAQGSIGGENNDKLCCTNCPTKPCDIVNIPIQRWVYIVVQIINSTVDVYINGKLARSCTLSNIPKFDNEGNIYISKDGGFKGLISDFMYSNKSLSPKEIYSIFMYGHTANIYYKYMNEAPPEIKLKTQCEIDLEKMKSRATDYIRNNTKMEDL